MSHPLGTSTTIKTEWSLSSRRGKRRRCIRLRGKDQVERRRRLTVLVQHRRNDRPPCKRPSRERLERRLCILCIYEFDVYPPDTSSFVCALRVEGRLEGRVSRHEFRLVFLDWSGDTKILDGTVSRNLFFDIFVNVPVLLVMRSSGVTMLSMSRTRASIVLFSPADMIGRGISGNWS